MTINKIDRHDVDRAELKLIRVGHFLWLDRKRALRASDVSLVHAIDASLEIVWELKKQVRVEVQARRAEAAGKVREYWRQRREEKTLPLAA